MKWPDHTAVAADAMEELGHWPLGTQGQPILGGRDEGWFLDDCIFTDQDAFEVIWPLDPAWHGHSGDAFCDQGEGGYGVRGGIGDSMIGECHHGGGDMGGLDGNGLCIGSATYAIRQYAHRRHGDLAG